MQYLLRNKIIILIVSILPCTIHAQILNREMYQQDHDDKKIHFGISLGVNRAYYNVSLDQSFAKQTSFTSVQNIPSMGINLAWLVNFRLGDYFDLRTYPLNLIFTEKVFRYQLTNPNLIIGEKSTMDSKVQGITMAFPVQLKFSSERIQNFKVFMLAGGKFEYDFAATAGEKESENKIKLRKIDYGMEAGLGFHFYFPVFVLTPELKVGWGFNNVHDRDPNVINSSVLDQIKARTLTLSFIIE